MIVSSGGRWTSHQFLLPCHVSSNQGEAEAFPLTFRLSLDHSVAEVWSSLFSREDITHHALLRDLFLKYIIWFLWLTKKKVDIDDRIQSILCPRDTFSMTVTVSVSEAVMNGIQILCFSCTLSGQLEERRYLWFFFFFCDYHLFSSFVVVTMKERMKEVSLFSKDRKTLFLRAFEKSLFGVTKLSLGICED